MRAIDAWAGRAVLIKPWSIEVLSSVARNYGMSIVADEVKKALAADEHYSGLGKDERFNLFLYASISSNRRWSETVAPDFRPPGYR